MCHNMSTSYVYSYTMHVSSVQALQVDSTNITPLVMEFNINEASKCKYIKVYLIEFFTYAQE